MDRQALSEAIPPVRRRILLICSTEIGDVITGPAIRVIELAKQLKQVGEITILAPGSRPSSPLDGIRIELFSDHSSQLQRLKTLAASSDVVVSYPLEEPLAKVLRSSGAQLIFDLYDPEPLENLALTDHLGSLQRSVFVSLSLDRLDSALRYGHHFLCASDHQKNLWIGVMLAKRLITPSIFDADPSLSSRISVVPFGLPEQPPTGSGPGPRDLFEPIAEDDPLVLWNGGIWAWLDPQTAISAVKELTAKRPNLRLVFMGNSKLPQGLKATEQAKSLAKKLNLLDKNVFFNKGWVPYAERASWLLDADCAISLHTDHLETRFAFRTRLLDCFWAGLPVICTEGDALSELIVEKDLGEVTPECNPKLVAEAIDRVLSKGKASYRQQLTATASEFRWSKTVRPLLTLIASSQLPTKPLGSHSPLKTRPLVAGRALLLRAARPILKFFRGRI